MSFFLSFDERGRGRKGITALFFFALISFLVPFASPSLAHAAVSSWDKGVTISPTSVDDFGTAAMKQSLDNARATGANFVAFVIPYYQSNIYATDIGPGWNTPSDSALLAATTYAHSIGLSVMFKVHPESYGGEWRANIDPYNRTDWFSRYQALLTHLGSLAEQNHVEMISIGTELVRLTSTSWNSSNTGYWNTLIGALRGTYHGKLTYGANSTYNQTDQYTNEKIYVGFWSLLDYASLSPYYNLDYGSNSVDSLVRAWDYWNKYDIGPFQAKIGKPILFGEIGYRSLPEAYKDPWNWSRSGPSDQQGQANDYQALMQYWNNYPYMQGIFWWNWSSNPTQISPGDTNYSPERKMAETILKNWFGGNPPPPAAQAPLFVGGGTATPRDLNVGQSVNLALNFTNNGGSLSGAIVDIEVYAKSGAAVFQKVFTGETLPGGGATKNYAATWTPNAPGDYVLRGGVFSSDWTHNYVWFDSAAPINVANAPTTPPPTTGGTSTSTTSSSSGTPAATGSQTVDVWWPGTGSHLSGLQPFKAMLENVDPSQYWMSWSVDGGAQNQMWDSTQDYPHKESSVDLTSWTWNSGGPYHLLFTAKDSHGTAYGTKPVDVYVDR